MLRVEGQDAKVTTVQTSAPTGKPLTMTIPRQRNVLFRRDVAAIWSRRAGRPIAPATVSSYVQRSKQADPAAGRPAGRFADDPVPGPMAYEGNRPVWEPTDEYPTIADVVKALEDWWDRQSGRFGDPRRR